MLPFDYLNVKLECIMYYLNGAIRLYYVLHSSALCVI